MTLAASSTPILGRRPAPSAVVLAFALCMMMLAALALPGGARAAAGGRARALALAGRARPGGYELLLARRAASGRWRWAPLGTLSDPATEGEPWTGYECLTGDGRYAVLVTAPQSAASDPVARDRGATAYAVAIGTGRAWVLARDVALKYYNPGCGAGSRVALTRSLGHDQAVTQVVLADLTAHRSRTFTVRGQATSAIPVRDGVAVATGTAVDLLRPSGARVRLLSTRATAYDLRAARGGGLDALVPTESGRRADLWHVAHGAAPRRLGRAPIA
ncbi:MAG TPA: hypothetical protein VNT55_17805, partial [Baekduia sp.]|nr:hypothetical protein [Baekduia sp.]